MPTMMELGQDTKRVRKGATRTDLTPSEIRGLLADVATAGGVPFIDAAQQARQGNYGQAAFSGLLDASGPLGKLAGLAAAPMMGAIKVFHGSPHKFDKFDMSKIGTGEGAQAYGHGLYFAESPKVATGYQKRLSDATSPYTYGFGGETYEGGVKGDPVSHALGLIYHQGKQTAQRIAKMGLADSKNGEAYALDMGGVPYYEKMLTTAREANKKDIKASQGNLYEVNLRWPGAREATDPLGPQHFLDYDKTLSQQSKFVQDALAKIGYSVDKGKVSEYDDALLSALSGKDVLVPKEPFDPSGERIINRLTNTFGDKVAASERLRSAGIPGVRYLDAMSRGQGGTSNYVTFDDQLAEILRRNPGLL